MDQQGDCIRVYDIKKLIDEGKIPLNARVVLLSSDGTGPRDAKELEVWWGGEGLLIR